MKGHTKIILTDVNTGEQQIHEDDNLVTAALDKIINISMSMNRQPNSDVLPIASNALGGLMLFDGTLTESEESIHFPTGVHLVGYAGQQSNTEDKYRGSFNALESGKTPTGFVSVWDFGTTQANGQIKAIARTHKIGGQNPIRFFLSGNRTYTESGAPQTDRGWTPIRYDGEYLYMLKGDSSTHVMRLARTRIPRIRFGCGDYSAVERTYEIVASWSTEVFTFTYYSQRGTQYETQYDVTVYADEAAMYEDGQDGYIYCMFYGVNSGYDTDFAYDINYFTIKYSDESFDKSETVHLNSGTAYYGYSVSYCRCARRDYGHVNHGILYRMSGTRKIIYAIPLSNVAAYRSTRILSDDNSDYLQRLMAVAPHSGGVWYVVYHYTASGYFYQNGILYPDGVYLTVEVQGQDADEGNASTYNYWGLQRTVDDDLTIWSLYDRSNGSYTYVSCDFAANYLGTINNLASPVTKTAAQTMKIIYTLTDVDEDDDE